MHLFEERSALPQSVDERVHVSFVVVQVHARSRRRRNAQLPMQWLRAVVPGPHCYTCMQTINILNMMFQRLRAVVPGPHCHPCKLTLFEMMFERLRAVVP